MSYLFLAPRIPSVWSARGRLAGWEISDNARLRMIRVAPLVVRMVVGVWRWGLIFKCRYSLTHTSKQKKTISLIQAKEGSKRFQLFLKMSLLLSTGGRKESVSECTWLCRWLRCLLRFVLWWPDLEEDDPEETPTRPRLWKPAEGPLPLLPVLNPWNILGVTF